MVHDLAGLQHEPFGRLESTVVKYAATSERVSPRTYVSILTSMEPSSRPKAQVLFVQMYVYENLVISCCDGRGIRPTYSYDNI